MTDNALIVRASATASGTAGLSVVQGIQGTIDATKSQDFVDPLISGASTAVEMLSMATDPLRAVVAQGVAWLIEHIQPLREALDVITGNADEINAYAATWTNISTSIAKAYEASDSSLKSPPIAVEWKGDTAESYRSNMESNVTVLMGLSVGAQALAEITSVLGTVVAGVRSLVVGVISDCVAGLITRLPRWLAEIAATLGLATPLVILEAALFIAEFIMTLTDLLDALSRTVGD